MASPHGAGLKRLAALSISVLYFGGARLRKGVRRWLRLQTPGTCVVLYYHGVAREHRARFARQMDLLLREAQPVAAGRKEPLAPGVHHAAVTFDDGYQNVIENALPELKSRRIPATVFVISEALGRFPFWLTDPRDPAHQDRVLSPDELTGMASELVAVGSHTMTHRALPELSRDEARRELSGSRAKLETMLHRPVTLFSFPYGAMNGELTGMCRESGYERVFTILPGLALSDPEEFVTPRVAVEPTDSAFEFRLKVMGAYGWLPLAYALKRKVRSTLLGRGKGKEKRQSGAGWQAASAPEQVHHVSD